MKTIDSVAMAPLAEQASVDIAQTPALPRHPRVQAIGEHLYIDGVACCPWCLEAAGSAQCRCGPGEVAVVLATALDLPPIHIDLRDGAR